LQQLILVNEQDEPIGQMEKMEVHRKGLLHRAFSVFIFNEKGEMLLQQRAAKKYHSPNLWSNACCSHPVVGEEIDFAANKRLQEELGFDTEIQEKFQFIYKTEFDNGLTEHEYDHVFTGVYNGEILPNPEEVGDYCYMTMDAIEESLLSHPAKYTSWFTIAFPKIKEQLA
jgi:isopentenyl-diphosphate delta-isomerase